MRLPLTFPERSRQPELVTVSHGSRHLPDQTATYHPAHLQTVPQIPRINQSDAGCCPTIESFLGLIRRYDRANLTCPPYFALRSTCTSGLSLSAMLKPCIRPHPAGRRRLLEQCRLGLSSLLSSPFFSPDFLGVLLRAWGLS